MGDFDYSTKPQMPQFREDDGRWDWRQMLDMVIPGNVWNSRTNQYRPLGIAQGLTGIPVDTLYGAARGAGSFLGRIGRGLGGSEGGNRAWMGPTRGGTPFSGRGPTVPDFAGQDIWGTRGPSRPVPDFAGQDLWGGRGQSQDPNWRMPGYIASGPTARRGGQGGYNGMSFSLARGLGSGMQRSNDQTLAEVLAQGERWRERNGMLQER